MDTVMYQETLEDLRTEAANIARKLADLTASDQACRCALGFNEEAYKEAYNDAFQAAFAEEYEVALSHLIAEQ